MFLQGFIAAVHGRYGLSTSAAGFERAREYGQVIFDTLMAATPTANTDDFAIESREAIYSCEAKDTFDSVISPIRYAEEKCGGSRRHCWCKRSRFPGITSATQSSPYGEAVT